MKYCNTVRHTLYELKCRIYLTDTRVTHRAADLVKIGKVWVSISRYRSASLGRLSSNGDASINENAFLMRKFECIPSRQLENAANPLRDSIDSFC